MNRPSFAKYLAVVSLLFIFQATSQAAVLVGSGEWSGSRSTATDVVAADGWTSPNGGFVIVWNISYDSQTNLFTYNYSFQSEDGTPIDPGVSHWLLEVSTSIDEGNYAGLIQNDNFSLVAPQTWTADPSPDPSGSPGQNNANPNLPADIYAIKLDTGSGEVANGTYSFQSERAPIWGDFYAKDGAHGPKGAKILATAWNSGIGTDPDDQTANFSAWIPTPDTDSLVVLVVQQVPEPASLIVWGSLTACGLATAAWRSRRRL